MSIIHLHGLILIIKGKRGMRKLLLIETELLAIKLGKNGK